MSPRGGGALALHQLGRRVDQFGERILAWDEAAMWRVSEHPLLCRLHSLLVVATYLGDGYVWGLLALYLICFGNRPDRLNVVVALGVLVVQITVLRAFKSLFARPRPLSSPPAARGRALAVDLHAFPSGHATVAFGVAYLIAHFYPSWGNVAAAYLLAGLIAISRVYLREHFPLDVVGGAALGTLLSHVLTPLIAALIR
ncbi:MAG: phosphatase PAP2 family protein [Candidatus Bipolaricaulaceae bacterium]